MAFAALPADGTDTVFAPRYDALVTAAERPRALNEFVGFRDSSLTNRWESPSSRPMRVTRINGVQPSPSVSGSSPSWSGISSRYRHMLGARLARLSRFHERAASRS